jgi:hypothetical protein
VLDVCGKLLKRPTVELPLPKGPLKCYGPIVHDVANESFTEGRAVAPVEAGEVGNGVPAQAFPFVDREVHVVRLTAIR